MQGKMSNEGPGKERFEESNDMKSLADGLPPEIARAIHPDWRKNEADYWAGRDQLLGQYKDLWIGFADGKVIVSGSSAVQVSHAARKLAQHPFVACVGREFEPSRIRRAAFPYDSTYPVEPLPVLPVEFRTQPGLRGYVIQRVIPDTGADMSALPWSDCLQLGLDPAQSNPSRMLGLGGTLQATIAFDLWVFMDGSEYECRVHVDFAGIERILGREVLNQMDVLFRGPGREVVINP